MKELGRNMVAVKMTPRVMVWSGKKVYGLVSQKGTNMLGSPSKKVFKLRVKELERMGVLKKSGYKYLVKVPRVIGRLME